MQRNSTDRKPNVITGCRVVGYKVTLKFNYHFYSLITDKKKLNFRKHFIYDSTRIASD